MHSKLRNLSEKYIYWILGAWIFLTVVRFSNLSGTILTGLIYPVFSILLRVLFLGCCLGRMEKFTVRIWLNIGAYLMISGLSLYITGETTFADAFMAAALMQDANHTRVIRAFLLSISGAFILVFCLTVLGLMYHGILMAGYILASAIRWQLAGLYMQPFY